MVAAGLCAWAWARTLLAFSCRQSGAIGARQGETPTSRRARRVSRNAGSATRALGSKQRSIFGGGLHPPDLAPAPPSDALDSLPALALGALAGLAGAVKEIAALGEWSGHAEDPDMFPVLRATATTTSARSSAALDLTTYAEAPAARAASRPSSPRSTKIEPLTSTTRHSG